MRVSQNPAGPLTGSLLTLCPAYSKRMLRRRRQASGDVGTQQ